MQVRRGPGGGDRADEYTAAPGDPGSNTSNLFPRSMATTHVLLHGAASPLGGQLLLKLALAGFEVTAQVPPAPWKGRTGEFAAYVTEESVPSVVAQATGDAMLVVAAGPIARAEVEASLAHGDRIERWVQCATREADLAEVAALLHAARVPVTTVLHPCMHGELQAVARQLLMRRTPLRAWRAQWTGPLWAVDEATVAEAAVKAMSRGREAVLVPGAAVTMTDVLRATVHSDGMSPWWLPLVAGRRRAAPALRFRRSDFSPSTLP